MREMRDEVDSCRFLFLRDLAEPEENSLRVIVEEAKAIGAPEDIEVLGTVISGTRVIDSDDTCRRFELFWPSYVAYFVRNESYTPRDDSENWVGNLLRIYSKSHFQDYISLVTFASEDYPGPMQHWRILCLRHLIDVVSCVPPEIRQLKHA